jgi:hypothetical protein
LILGVSESGVRRKPRYSISIGFVNNNVDACPRAAGYHSRLSRTLQERKERFYISNENAI